MSTFGVRITTVIGSKSFITLYRGFRYKPILIENTPIDPTIIVYPSAGAFAKASAAIEPLAPGRFSTTVVYPASFNFCATARATMSLVPPATKGTSTFTGLLG